MNEREIQKRENIFKGTLAGLLFLAVITTPLLRPIFNQIDNYFHSKYYEKQGRIAEQEFTEYKSRLLAQMSSPEGSCDLLKDPTNENCFYFYRIGGQN